MTEPARTPAPRRRHGPIAAAFAFVARATCALLLALFTAVALQLAGMTWWWPDEGSAHSRRMLAQELGYLADDFRAGVMASAPAAFAREAGARAYHWLSEWTRLTDLARRIRGRATMPVAGESRLTTVSRRALKSLEEYGATVAASVRLYATRLAVLVLSLPAFLLAGVVGLADGLAQRDLRRWGGGHERGFVYHHAKRLVMPCLAGAWLLYLCLPWSVNPTYVVVPFAALFGTLVAVTAATFKKHL